MYGSVRWLLLPVASLFFVSEFGQEKSGFALTKVVTVRTSFFSFYVLTWPRRRDQLDPGRTESLASFFNETIARLLIFEFTKLLFGISFCRVQLKSVRRLANCDSRARLVSLCLFPFILLFFRLSSIWFIFTLGCHHLINNTCGAGDFIH